MKNSFIFSKKSKYLFIRAKNLKHEVNSLAERATKTFPQNKYQNISNKN